MAGESEESDFRFGLGHVLDEVQSTYAIPGASGRRGVRGVALDLGMNVGAFSIFAASSYGHIWGVEASSACIRESQENFARFQTKDVTIIHRALARRSGELAELRRVYIDGDFRSQNFSTLNLPDALLEETDFGGRFREVEERVETISWADLIQQTVGNGSIRLVKCDIEGSEYELLYGSDLSMVEFMILELHYTALGKEKTFTLIDHLFRYFSVLDPRDGRRLRRREWPPPELLWLVNRRKRNFYRTFLSCSALLSRRSKRLRARVLPSGK